MLLSVLTFGNTCLPNSMYSDTPAHAAIPYQAFHYNTIYLSRWLSGEALCRNRLPGKGFSLQYRLLIALAFEKGAGAKLSRGVPLQYRLLIALTFERYTVAKLSGYNQAHHLSVKPLGRVGSQLIILRILNTYNSWKQKVKGITTYERI